MANDQSRGIKWMLSEKMRCLEDFGICKRNDREMKAKLERAIAEKPNKDPQVVLDYYCRPMIQDVINKWK